MAPTTPTTSPFDCVWDRPLPANRGRDGVLHPDEIAGVAIAVADAEGLTAATVRRVATRLRVPSARLENYVRTRDELHDLMLDDCLRRVELPDPAAPWRAQWQQLARELYELVRGHRCLMELIGARSPSGPHGLRFVEHALAASRAAGVDVRSSALSFNAVLAYVCGAASMELRRGGSAPRQPAGAADYLAHTIAGGGFPALADLLADAPDLTGRESFEHGLRLLLDGVTAAPART